MDAECKEALAQYGEPEKAPARITNSRREERVRASGVSLICHSTPVPLRVSLPLLANAPPFLFLQPRVQVLIEDIGILSVQARRGII